MFFPVQYVTSTATPSRDRVWVHAGDYCLWCGHPVLTSTRETRAQSHHGRAAAYCTPEHKTLAGAAGTAKRPRRRSITDRSNCPRPDKQSFANEAQARASFTDFLREDPTFNVYACQCGWWHGGRSASYSLLASRVANGTALALAFSRAGFSPDGGYRLPPPAPPDQGQ